MLNRIKIALCNEKGALAVEQIVLISVILVLATTLFAFRGQIAGFITKAGQEVNNLQVK